MGVNYGQFRNRKQSLKALKGVIMESIGNYDLNYAKFDYTETADLINSQLDKVQESYNARFNFPNT